MLWNAAASFEVLQKIRMKSLYLWLDLGSFLIPFLFSFHPKIQFYKKWPSFLLGTLIMMAVFIPWDIIFTNNGFWGFNPEYLTGIYFLNLPLEEWLFFFCIPYACIFTHYALTELLPSFRFTKKTAMVLYSSVVTLLILVLWYRYDRWYTMVNFGYALLLLGFTLNRQPEILGPFFASFLVILIPFFIVNGILTGSYIPEPVVWYNNAENLGIRMGTIPVEDTIYNLGMLLTVVLVMELHLKKKSSSKELLS